MTKVVGKVNHIPIVSIYTSSKVARMSRFVLSQMWDLMKEGKT